MKEIDFKFTVGSHVDFEDLIADIEFEGHHVALLTQEEGFENLRILIDPPNNQEFWDFRFDEFEDIINRTKKRLWELRRISN